MQNFIFERIDERSGSITESEYHAIKGALSNSRMDTLIYDTPAHYWAALEKPSVQTKAMAFGSAYHCYMLETDDFYNRFAILPPGFDGRTKAGKELMQQITDSGKLVITDSEYSIISEMSYNLVNHAFANSKIENATCLEWPIVANALQIGAPHNDIFAVVKGKADIVGCNYIADLKTISDLRDDTIARAIRDGYARQGAFYLDLFGKEVFYLIFQEKSSPYEIRVIRLNEAQIDYGRAQYELALHRYNAMLAEKAIGRVLAYPQVEELEIWLPGKKTDYTESEAGF